MAFCGYSGGSSWERRKYKNSRRSANIADFFVFVLLLYVRVTHFQEGRDCWPTQRVEVFGVLEGCLLSRAMCLARGKLRALTLTA